MLFVWSQSQDETVLQDTSAATGLERTTLASTAALNSAQQQHDNDENSMLDNNKPGADIRQDSFPLSDCHIQDDLDTDNELEALVRFILFFTVYVALKIVIDSAACIYVGVGRANMD